MNVVIIVNNNFFSSYLFYLQYDALFMKSLLPEWILSIFMQRNSFDRKTAIEKILSQKMQSDQNEEQYTSLINVRLDDTVNLTKM